jgi:hypothetical protein
MRSLSILTLSLFLMSCGLSQNPLEKYPNAVQNPKPPATKPEVPEAIPSDALRLNAPDVVTFVETVESQFDLSGRVLIPGYVGRIEIINLADFQGAKFDPATGAFKWLPPKGIVMDGLMTERELLVRLVAESEEKLPLIRLKSIKVLIQRLAGIPVVESVTTNATLFREGESYDFDIVVKDPDAGFVEELAPQVLILTPQNISPKIKSLSGYMTLSKKQLSSDGKSWIFSYRLNLNGEEVTDSSVQGGFDIQAVSRFGGVSAVVPYRAKVFTRLGRMVSNNQRDKMLVPAGQSFQYVFFTWDPKLEAKLELVSYSGLPPNVTFVCSAVSQGQLRCVLNWTPTETQIGSTYNLTYVVRGSNTDSTDTQTVTETFTQRISIVKADEKLPPVSDERDTPGDGGSDIQLPDYNREEGK